MAKKATIADVLDAVKGINERLAKLEEKKDVFTLNLDSKNDSSTFTTPLAPVEPEYPVPSEYRAFVDEILSPAFGIKIEPDSDRPAFTLKILVPKEFSNATEEYWRTNKCDVRAKVLTYGEGALGVKTYVELVKANLGPEIAARISASK